MYFLKTSMHSSRMRTAHALTFFPGVGGRGCGCCWEVGGPPLGGRWYASRSASGGGLPLGLPLGVGGPPQGPPLRGRCCEASHPDQAIPPLIRPSTSPSDQAIQPQPPPDQAITSHLQWTE